MYALQITDLGNAYGFEIVKTINHMDFMPITAVVKSDISDKIIDGFQPLIDVLQGLAYPITFLSIGAGILMISLGQKNKGLELCKYGAIGYLAMQFLPSLMKILAQVGKAMG